jgi:hypothetical protein
LKSCWRLSTSFFAASSVSRAASRSVLRLHHLFGDAGAGRRAEIGLRLHDLARLSRRSHEISILELGEELSALTWSPRFTRNRRMGALIFGTMFACSRG